MHQPTPKALQAAVDGFNRRYPIGTDVLLKKDDGSMIETKTRSRAEVLSGHSAVIWLEGISGYYLLSRVTPIAAIRKVGA
ncbi:hypothetical protein [Sinorhizobium fredii]|uniref:hypothetical protein n=1 Tax=Rhizobium fredii TaxID=380 RepID=UPI0004AEA072|nr:hypothetical protein [Sinorhizobium fredii]ASY69355.1 hypothetical protein SF83666_c19390 [Sinorhizobium fredii CCBAU 83666]